MYGCPTHARHSYRTFVRPQLDFTASGPHTKITYSIWFKRFKIRHPVLFHKIMTTVAAANYAVFYFNHWVLGRTFLFYACFISTPTGINHSNCNFTSPPLHLAGCIIKLQFQIIWSSPRHSLVEPSPERHRTSIRTRESPITSALFFLVEETQDLYFNIFLCHLMYRSNWCVIVCVFK